MSTKRKRPALRNLHILLARAAGEVRWNDIQDIPDVLKRIINEDLWQEFREGGFTHGALKQFARFPQFLEYLGTTYETVYDLCRRDGVAQNKLDEAVQNPHGVHTDVNNVNVRPQGNSQAQGLRRLRKSRPDLLARVLGKELSINKAMVVGGFCWTEQAIADEVGLDRTHLGRIIEHFCADAKTHDPPTTLQDFNIWDFGLAADGAGDVEYPGRMP